MSSFFALPPPRYSRSNCCRVRKSSMVFSTRRFHFLWPTLRRAASPTYRRVVFLPSVGNGANSVCGISSSSRNRADPGPQPRGRAPVPVAARQSRRSAARRRREPRHGGRTGCGRARVPPEPALAVPGAVPQARAHRARRRAPDRPAGPCGSRSWPLCRCCRWPARSGRAVVSRGAHSDFTAWPPNWLRIAASSLSENESVSRERSRSISASEITGAATLRSIASATVQRPSPESAT